MNIRAWHLALCASILSAPLGAQTSCPAPSPLAIDDSREAVTMFLTHTQYADERAEAGLPAIDSTHVRLLTDGADAHACEVLWADIRAPMYRQAPWIAAFFEADGFYFVTFVKGPVAQTRIRVENGRLIGSLYWRPFLVYDASLTNRLSFAM